MQFEVAVRVKLNVETQTLILNPKKHSFMGFRNLILTVGYRAPHLKTFLFIELDSGNKWLLRNIEHVCSGAY